MHNLILKIKFDQFCFYNLNTRTDRKKEYLLRIDSTLKKSLSEMCITENKRKPCKILSMQVINI